MDDNRCALMAQITETSFAMDEARLFLDTHPCDKRAAAFFNENERIRRRAVEEYTRLYGPISAYDVSPGSEKSWQSGPWPWESGV